MSAGFRTSGNGNCSLKKTRVLLAPPLSGSAFALSLEGPCDVVHLPYIQPGETRSLTPIMLETYRGGWQHRGDIYKTWRSSWMVPPAISAWAQEPHAWQQIQINSPKDELRMPFRDLVKVGEECARHGVKAIQLVGWNDGSQDQGNPSHDPDPRLGTFEELKQAVARIQALGVKVILFSKFTWADRATERFRNDLVAWRSRIRRATATCTRGISTRRPHNCWTSTSSAWFRCAS